MAKPEDSPKATPDPPHAADKTPATISRFAATSRLFVFRNRIAVAAARPMMTIDPMPPANAAHIRGPPKLKMVDPSGTPLAGRGPTSGLVTVTIAAITENVPTSNVCVRAVTHLAGHPRDCFLPITGLGPQRLPASGSVRHRSNAQTGPRAGRTPQQTPSMTAPRERRPRSRQRLPQRE